MIRKLLCKVTVPFQNEDVVLELWEQRYAMGGRAIYATQIVEGGRVPFGIISVNLPAAQQFLGPEEFFVKGWSENEGWAEEALRQSGLFEPTTRYARTGFVEAFVWRDKALTA